MTKNTIMKYGLAVFNPQNPIEKCIQDCYHDITGKWLCQNEIVSIISSFLNFESFFEGYQNFSKIINKKIFSTQNDSNYYYIPIYTLELRQILQNKKIQFNRNIGGGALKIIQEFFSSWPCFLVIDADVNIPMYEFGGWAIWDENIDLSEGLVRISSLERIDSPFFQEIKNIVKEICPSLEVFSITETPGLSSNLSKIANKYIVNLGKLDIEDEVIHGKSEEDAVEKALEKAWKKTKNPHKDPVFTVEHWKRNEFWPAIVKKASKESVQLNELEKKIFDFLLYINDKYELGLTFRVAGGWVRDKLLGKESDDIDIAIDKMTGAQFGEYLQKELGESGNIIKANPDQSKHLETMTINIFGQDIDFVNLRNESYGDSRIPEMEFGTAEQDAFRRDLTINSLFYNINTTQVEDFTGKGIEDLDSMVLRTPLDPIKTFTDDPLRILRMLRFYSRYEGSTIDPSAIEAMKNNEVQEALKVKVTPERILKEWKKTFEGKQVSQALRVLYETGIWDNVIKAKTEDMKGFNPFTTKQNNPHHVDNVFEHTLRVVEEYQKILDADNAGKEERALGLMAAFFHDLGKLDPSIIGIKETAEGIHNTYHGHEDVSANVAKSLLSALKASNKDIEYVETIARNHMIPHQHTNEITDKQLRKLIRNLGHNILKRVVQHAKADAGSKPNTDLSPYDNLINRVQTIQPSTSENVKKPVLSGDIIMQMFPDLKPKTGFIKFIQDFLQDKKDENPNEVSTNEQITALVNSIAQTVYNQFGNKPKTAQNYFKEIRNLGVKPTVKWTCGEVFLRKNRNEHSIHPEVWFRTAIGEYELFLDEADKFDERLLKLKGNIICAKGIIDAERFIMSDWTIYNKKKNDSEKHMIRYEPDENTLFQVGDKVRNRRRSMAFNQIYGQVRKIEDNLMYIKWDGIKDSEVFDLDDTIGVYSTLEKV